tara:strand:+ start:14848 stop:15762 length:915 start_codon:yes stop_codon:yes gene_type:complete
MTQTNTQNCACFWLGYILSIPDVSSYIDEKTKELHWHNKGSDTEEYMVFKFCPICGHKIAKHEQNYVKDGISKQECVRLINLIKPIGSLQAFQKKMGAPQKETKYLTYTRYSEIAIIDILFERKNDADNWKTTIDFLPYKADKNSADKTKYHHCSCDKLQECRNAATTDIKYQSQDKYYVLSYEAHFGKYMDLMHFCPFCGEALLSASPTKPSELSTEKSVQLNAITDNIKSAEDAYEKLGKPCGYSKQRHYENVSDEANLLLHMSGDEFPLVYCIEIVSKSHAPSDRYNNLLVTSDVFLKSPE